MEKCEEDENLNLEKKNNIHDDKGVDDVNPVEKIEKTIETTERRRAWEDLPYHILELFLKQILEPRERPNLSRVCKAWKEFKSPYCFPALVRGRTICEVISSGDGVGVDEYPIKNCLGSSHGWLIIRMKKKHDQIIRRKNKKECDQKHHRSPNELYYLLNIYTKDTIQLPSLWYTSRISPTICLSSAPTNPDCIAVMFDLIFFFGGFLFTKRGCDTWIQCKYDFHSKPAPIDLQSIHYSVIPFRGKFYALGSRQNLVVIDMINHDDDDDDDDDEPTTTATAKTLLIALPVNGGGIFPTGNSVRHDWYLVESLGKLLVVTIYRNERTKKKDIKNISVFELDFETMSWIKMKNLPDDQVLFIEFRSCFSISGREIEISSSNGGGGGRYNNNCIYVSDGGKVHRYDMHNQEIMVCTSFPETKVFDKLGMLEKYRMCWVKPTYV